jgi:phenylacetate-coenzyme A ligase PaaK-like adenylate-forming protein
MHASALERLRAEIERGTHEHPDIFAWTRDVRLTHLLRFHYENPRNSAYRDLLRSHGIDSARQLPLNVAGLTDLPLVEKDFLRAADYANAPTVPASQVRFVISTSGSTGAPMRVPHSYDFERRIFGDLFVRLYLMLGHERLLAEPAYFVSHFTPSTKATGTYACFTQLRDLWGAEATVGNTSDAFDDHLRALSTARSSCTAPGFYLATLAAAHERGVDLSATPLDLVIMGGAPVSAENHARIKHGFGLSTLRLGYVNSELGWLGVQLEDGGPYTIFDDEFIVEVLDEQGRHVAPGERGRVAVTALSSDAAPLIRYACGDTARYLGHTGPYANFCLLDEISRDTMAIIGDGKVMYDDLAEMPRTMASLGAPVAAFQLAKRRAADGRDQVHLRVELVDPGQDCRQVEHAAVAALRRHPHMDFHIGDGELPYPIVETYQPGHLTTGRFKVPLYVDETKPVAVAPRHS